MTSDATELSPLKRALVEIRDLKARVAEADRRDTEPIAIIGMGMRLPGGANDSDTFWKLLANGVDAIGDVPADRWPIDAHFDADPEAIGKISARQGGFVDDVTGFDAQFFGISPREAANMDPQQRMLLEVAWESLERAAIPVDQMFGSRTGVYVGMTNSDFSRMSLGDHDRIDTYTPTGTTLSVTAGRLSYILGAQGPSMVLDTACSSSLVAIHLAAKSLRSGESDLALAGGVGLILAPEMSIGFSRARVLAPDGRCKAFDTSADGMGRSEGCAVVVLKRLSDALAAGDHVLATVRGSAVNQDGRSGGLTAPNGPSQEAVIAGALADAGIAPHDIDYVETHGTGTPLGDPIEAGALGRTLAVGRPADQPLLIGSVKTNIGHTEAAAGVAGLIKAVLMLQHDAVPPHLHLDELSPLIAAEGFPISIPTELTPWPRQERPRHIGVSSFGISGTNAHLVISDTPVDTHASHTAEPADKLDHPAATSTGAQLLVLSARSPGTIASLAAAYVDTIDTIIAADDGVTLADVAWQANTTRMHLDHRVAIVATDLGDARDQLVQITEGHTTSRRAHASLGVAVVFTGHGAQYAGMGASLYAQNAVFRAAFDRCAELLRDRLDSPLTEIVFEDAALLDVFENTQPAIFSLHYALAETWKSWGMTPAVVAGHSIGEYAAAVVSGVMSLADGISAVCERARLLASLPPGGQMATIFLPEAEVRAAIDADTGVDAASTTDANGDVVGIAAVNGPNATVVSGTVPAVRALVSRLGVDDDDWRVLDVSVGGHSPLVEPILDDYEQHVSALSLARPDVPLVSSMTGKLEDEALSTTRYWRDHVRQPVRFAEVFDQLRTLGHTVFLEMGSKPTLVKMGRRMWPDDLASWAHSLDQDGDARHQMLTAAGVLYQAGIDLDWDAIDGRDTATRRRVDLPTYPFQHEHFPLPDQRRSSAFSAEAWPAALQSATETSLVAPLDLQVESYEQRWATLDQLAADYTVAALVDLGVLVAAGSTTSVDQLVATGTVAESHHHLVGQWLEHLADDKTLERVGDGVFRTATGLQARNVEASLARAREVHVGTEPLVGYVARCGDRLAEVVSGRESPLNTLFPDGSYETVDFLYNEWSVARYMNGIARSVASAIAAVRPTLRVIEIGAGTGGMTAALLDRFTADRTAYTFTDVSDFFLVRAAERFEAYPFVEYSLLDIERPPTEQDYVAGGYDLVVAANVLHATSDLDATLQHIRSLLAPGGMLMAYEATHHPRWFDVSTALIEGWQRFEDDWRVDHPLISAESWRGALDAAGFETTATLPADDTATSILGQHIVLAGLGGTAVDSDLMTLASTHAANGSEARQRVELPSAEDIAAALDASLDDDRIDVMIDAVRQSIASVLRVSDPAALDRSQPLLDLGFDSLMAVELRNVLRVVLGLDRKLPATLVFDHPNISAIADYVLAVVDGRIDIDEDADDVDVDPRIGGAHQPTATSAEELAEMSDDDVERMLLEKLGSPGPDDER